MIEYNKIQISRNEYDTGAINNLSKLLMLTG